MLRFISEFIGRQRQQLNFEDYPHVEKAIHFIHENEDKEITVKQLADIVYLTPDHFSKIFKKALGVRPIEYIHQKRLQRVRLLLLTTNLSMADIAIKVGFSSPIYLLRIFRKHMGVTLSQYRKVAQYG